MADITMPKMGFDMQEGTIVRWLKKPGDAIKRGEPIAEIETDKVTIEIEAFDSGVLGDIVVQEGQVAPVNGVIAHLKSAGDERPAGEATTAAVGSGEGGEARPVEQAAGTGGTARVTQEHPAVQPSGTVSSAAPQVDGQPVGEDGDVKASPLARRMAREGGIDLRQISGSGPGGRVVKEDVESFLGKQGVAVPAPVPAAAPVPARPAPMPVPVQQAPAAPVAAPTPAPAAGGRVVPLSNMRKTIARRMVQSWQQNPHIFVSIDVDMGTALALRKQANEGQPKEAQFSVNDLVVKACATALASFPNINASYSDEGIVQHPPINISIAVAVDNGLLAPVIAGCQDRSLGSIGRETKRLVGLARENKLAVENLQGGTFTVSNLGMYGVTEFTSIITPPQAASLAVSAIQRLPRFNGDSDEVVAVNLMKITLSADHRVTDGAEVARFVGEIKRLLENPLAMLVS